MELSIAVSLAVIGGLMGMYSGSYGTSKAWRRYGIPLLIITYGLLFKGWWPMMSLLFIPILSQGYGVPDINDDGSRLGDFWYGIIGSNYIWVDIAVRGSIGLMLVLSCIYAPIISGAWLTYLFVSLGFLLIHILFSAIIEGEKVITNGDYTFLVEDLIVYTNITAYGIWMASMV